MGRLYIFMGKSAAGKDTLFQKILEEDPALKQVVPYTTRPVRQGEKEGVAYHFVSEDTMNDMRQQGRIIECRCYETVQGPWYYFTADDGQIDFEQGDCCMISTLEGYEKIRDYYGEQKVVPLYIEVEDGLRLERALDRERKQQPPKYEEMCRRFLADQADYSEEKLKAAGITQRYSNEKDLMSCVETLAAVIREYGQK